MRYWGAIFIGVVSAFSAICGEFRFPELKDLPADTVLAPHPAIEVAPEGHLLVNRKPRFLIGTTYYKEYGINGRRLLTGYPPELCWIYENALDYTGLQRLGFDTVGSMTPDDWIEHHGYNAREKYEIFYVDDMRRYFQAGLPLYVDFTPSGRIRRSAESGNDLTAFIDSRVSNTSLVPMYYSFSTAAGRKAWREMWDFGVRFILKNGGRPVFYELLNQPYYDDRSQFNRQKFTEILRKKYENSIHQLNREWHTAYPDFESIGKFNELDQNALRVEWKQFMGEQLNEICQEGIRTIEAADSSKNHFFCIQLPNNQPYDSTVVNRQLFRRLSAVSAVAENVYQANFLRALAKGKPLINPESTPRLSRSGFRDQLWLDFARGYNLSYLYKWSAARYDKIWIEQPEKAGEIQRIKKPYLLLNPYSVKPEYLLGIQDAKQEILRYGESFQPRDRGIRNQLAFLVSTTSNDLRDTSHVDSQMMCANALASAQFSYDIVFEAELKKQLESGQYTTLIAPGVNSVLSETPESVKHFVTNGGTLILFRCALENDKYGFPRKNNSFPGISFGAYLSAMPHAKNWHGGQLELAPYRQVRMRVNMQHELMYGLTPLLSSMEYGRGRVIFLNVSAENVDLGELFDQILTKCKIASMCQVIDEISLRKVPNIEVWKTRGKNDKIEYLIFNQSFFSSTVRFIPREQGIFRDPIRGKTFDNSDGGGFLLTLDPGERNLICKAAVAPNDRPAATLSVTDLKNAQTSKLFFFNLSHYANCSFTDITPRSGPGKDYGWLDIGEKGSIYDLPVGISRLENGMYWQFVDPNKNMFKTCLSLHSQKYRERPEKVEIPLSKRLAALNILHTAGGGSQAHGSEVLRYTVVYADHTKVAIPIRYMETIDDYKAVGVKRPGRLVATGFRNRHGCGLYHFRWKNPKPDIPILLVKIESVEAAVTPMIAAITGELFDSVHLLNPLAGKDVSAPLRLFPGKTLTVPFSIPLVRAPDFESAELRIELDLLDPQVRCPDFWFKLGNTDAIKSVDCELESKKSRRKIYVLPLSPRELSSPEDRIDQISLYLAGSETVPFSLKINKIVYINSLSANPLSFCRASNRMNGIKRIGKNIHRLELAFSARRRRAEVVSTFADVPFLPSIYLNAMLCFSIDNQSNAERIIVQAESRDSTGKIIYSPFIEFVFPPKTTDNETLFVHIPAFRLLQKQSRTLSKLRLVFLPGANQGSVLEGELSIYNLQLN